MENEFAEAYFIRRAQQVIGELPYYDDNRARDESYLLDELGIALVRKRAVGLVFFLGKDPTVRYMWVGNPDSLPSFPSTHAALKCELLSITASLGILVGNDMLSIYLVEDGDGNLHALAESGGTAESLRRGLDDTEQERWRSLMQRYRITSFLRHVCTRFKGEECSGTIHSYEPLISNTNFEKLREQAYLNYMARRYMLTNTQFMRYRLFRQGLYELGVKTFLTFDEHAIIASIIEDD